MRKEEIEKVRKILREEGDDFWREGEDDPELEDNTLLFEEIVQILNRRGLDLELKS